MDAKKINYINWWQKDAASAQKAPELSVGKSETTNANVQEQAQAQPKPFIQPLVVVPYVSTKQPLYHFNPNEKEEEVDASYYEDLFEDEESAAYSDSGSRSARARRSIAKDDEYEGKRAIKSKRSKTGILIAVITAVLSAAFIALAFDLKDLIGGFTSNYVTFVLPMPMIELVKGTFETIKEIGFGSIEEMLIPLLVSVSFAFTAITLIVAILTGIIIGKGRVATVITSAIALIGSAGALVVALAIEKYEFDLCMGYVIFAAISAIIFVINLLGVAVKKKRA